MTIGENYYYGGLLRFDLSPKPAYYTIKNLIWNIWHTEENLITDQNGVSALRGFYGEYELEITVEGKTVQKTINLSSKSNNKIKINLTE